MVGIDMKMPEICGKCRFATAFECIVNREFIPDFDKRAPHCPLVQITAGNQSEKTNEVD